MEEVECSVVPFNSTNVGKCLCPNCPVQSISQCAAYKLATISESLLKDPLQKEDIPGEYCSTGVATCRDLDPTLECMCPQCTVFEQYALSNCTPVGWYCSNGFAG